MESWLCPSCTLVLSAFNNGYRCTNNHCYDTAKEGYVNLLLAHQKNSKDPGDNKAMVNGRRLFLEQGFYQPLAEKLSQVFIEYGSVGNENKAFHLFDAGCGEGYYLNYIYQQCLKQKLAPHFSGVDIAKNAVLKAAKKYPHIDFAVASTFNLPVPSASQDGVLQIFAPSNSEEIKRILKPGGIWVKVDPAPEHLHQLKQLIYDNPETHPVNDVQEQGFELKEQIRLNFEFELTQTQHREALLMMTPFYWTASPEKKHAVMDKLTQVSADFSIKTLVKVL